MIVSCNHCEIETEVSDEYRGKVQDIARESGFEPIFITPVSSKGPKMYCDKCLNMIRKGDPWD